MKTLFIGRALMGFSLLVAAAVSAQDQSTNTKKPLNIPPANWADTYGAIGKTELSNLTIRSVVTLENENKAYRDTRVRMWTTYAERTLDSNAIYSYDPESSRGVGQVYGKSEALIWDSNWKFQIAADGRFTIRLTEKPNACIIIRSDNYLHMQANCDSNSPGSQFFLEKAVGGDLVYNSSYPRELNIYPNGYSIPGTVGPANIATPWSSATPVYYIRSVLKPDHCINVYSDFTPNAWLNVDRCTPSTRMRFAITPLMSNQTLRLPQIDHTATYNTLNNMFVTFMSQDYEGDRVEADRYYSVKVKANVVVGSERTLIGSELPKVLPFKSPINGSTIPYYTTTTPTNVTLSSSSQSAVTNTYSSEKSFGVENTTSVKVGSTFNFFAVEAAASAIPIRASLNVEVTNATKVAWNWKDTTTNTTTSTDTNTGSVAMTVPAGDTIWFVSKGIGKTGLYNLSILTKNNTQPFFTSNTRVTQEQTTSATGGYLVQCSTLGMNANTVTPFNRSLCEATVPHSATPIDTPFGVAVDVKMVMVNERATEQCVQAKHMSGFGYISFIYTEPALCTAPDAPAIGSIVTTSTWTLSRLSDRWSKNSVPVFQLQSKKTPGMCIAAMPLDPGASSVVLTPCDQNNEPPLATRLILTRGINDYVTIGFENTNGGTPLNYLGSAVYSSYATRTVDVTNAAVFRLAGTSILNNLRPAGN